MMSYLFEYVDWEPARARWLVVHDEAGDSRHYVRCNRAVNDGKPDLTIEWNAQKPKIVAIIMEATGMMRVKPNGIWKNKIAVENEPARGAPSSSVPNEIQRFEEYEISSSHLAE